MLTVPFRALVLGLAGLVLAETWARKTSRNLGPAQWLVAAVFAAMILRMLWDYTFVQLPLDLDWTYYWTMFLGGAVLPACALLRPIDEKRLCATLLFCEVFGALALALLVALVASRVKTPQDLLVLRLGTETLNPISMGHFGVSLAIVVGQSLVLARGHSTLHTTILRSLVLVVSIVVVVLSGSRGPLIAFAAAFAVFIASFWRSIHAWLWAVFAAFAVAVIWGILEFQTELAIVSRFSRADVDDSNLARVSLFTGAVNQFEESPILGSAVVEYTQRFYPHNIVLESMMSLGFVGASAMIILIAISLKYCRSLLVTNGGASPWIGLLYVQYLVDSMLSGSIALGPQFWCVTSVVIAAANLRSVGAMIPLNRSRDSRESRLANQRDRSDAE